jgi:hypothetical protein
MPGFRFLSGSSERKGTEKKKAKNSIDLSLLIADVILGKFVLYAFIFSSVKWEC